MEGHIACQAFLDFLSLSVKYFTFQEFLNSFMRNNEWLIIEMY